MNIFFKKISIFSLFLSLLIVLFSVNIFAEQEILAGNVDMPGDEKAHAKSGHYHTSRPDGHAPITVMGEHIHGKGEWMLSYRYMNMRMSGSRMGHDDINTTDVLTDFPVAPTDMTMNMHMLGLMIAPSDKFTLMAMLPIVRKDMNHVTRGGLSFRTHSEGIGDLKVSGLIPVLAKDRHRIHLNASLSVPIGEIDEHGDTPAATNVRLPYPMQLGSGTWDLLPGMTYNGQSDNWSWGSQGMLTLRPGRNNIGYSLGNEYQMTVWGARKWAAWISNSIGIQYKIWQNIGGRDSSLAPMMVPTADPKSRGGKRMDFLFGLNLYVPKGLLKGQRASIDFGIPFMQSLDGPQLETDWYFTAGWQAAFG